VAGRPPSQRKPAKLTPTFLESAMPIRQTDILKDISSRINPDVNPYVARMTAALADGSIPVLQGSALKECKGNWRGTFDRLHTTRGRLPGLEKRPLIVEIGCHLGLTLNQMAGNHPDADFVGMDITFKRVVTAAERSIRQRHRNVVTVLGNARGMDAIFADGEVDGFVIFFPDPWMKRAQNKHRLVDREFAGLLSRKLAPGAFVWMKTDQEGYWREARESFMEAGFTPTEPVDFFAGHIYESTFERRFRLQGLPAHGGHMRKPATRAN
jgi:tRNA (guanine-N7-)-methyltransferase